MEIKVPADITGMRIKHFGTLAKLDDMIDPYDPTITEKVNINSAFTGLPVDQLKQADLHSNNELFRQILRSFDTYHPKPMPPAELEFEGKKYIFVKDFSKLPTGWFIDLSRYGKPQNPDDPNSSRMKQHPALMAAMCYIEEGMTYAQQDANKNTINPSQERMKVFEKHMQLNHFIDLSAFFLKILVEWKGSSLQTERRMTRLNNLKANLHHLNGKRQFMQYQRNLQRRGKK